MYVYEEEYKHVDEVHSVTAFNTGRNNRYRRLDRTNFEIISYLCSHGSDKQEYGVLVHE